MSEDASGEKATTTKQGDETTTTTEKVRTDRNDEFNLRVLPNYICDSRPASLSDLPPEPLSLDDRDNPNNKKRKGKHNKKKRPRDIRIPNSEKICLAIVKGLECPYGPSCKFSHDLKAFLKTRPEDIQATCPLTADGECACPVFVETGYCHFGTLCRFGSCHVLKATGENVKRDDYYPPPPVKNFLPKEILIQLRKKQYKFKCAQKNKTTRNMERHAQGKNKHKNTTEEEEKKGAPKTDGTEIVVDEKKEATTDALKKEEDETKTKEDEEKAFQPIQDPFRPPMKLEYMKNPSTDLPPKPKRTIDFSNKIYIAPLTTVGNLPFRRIMKKFGADITCGEMAVAGNLLEGKPSEWALLKRHVDEDVFGIQIASGYPDQFTRVAEVIEQHLEVDFVDMNLGCPLDIICQKGAGAGLMLRPNRLKGILSGVTGTLSCPVTVKMRTGWDTGKPFAHQLVPKIQSWGMQESIAAIMIHGRSRLQRYQNLADWDYIDKVSKSQSDEYPKLNIIGNGDILSYTDYEERTNREGISSCAMLGRGALIKPWLPTEIKERRNWDISSTERLDILKDFVRFGLTHWGSDQQGVDNTRRFLLEWLSFLHRYVPIGLLEGGVPQKMNLRPPLFMCGRNDLETLMLSPHSHDWIKISEMLLGPVPDNFRFEPKHKARSYRDQPQ